MRKINQLDALFPRVRQGVLSALLLNPLRRWYLNELAKHLKLTPSSLQREISALVKAGILCRQKDGNRVYYQANEECPFLKDLQGLFVKTVGFVDRIRAALRPYTKDIQVAFIYGSIARGEEVATSDVDLLVIGGVGLADIAPSLRKVQEQLKRPVNATVYVSREFAKKGRGKHHFVSTVLDEEKLFVIGSISELEEIIGRAAG